MSHLGSNKNFFDFEGLRCEFEGSVGVVLSDSAAEPHSELHLPPEDRAHCPEVIALLG